MRNHTLLPTIVCLGIYTLSKIIYLRPERQKHELKDIFIKIYHLSIIFQTGELAEHFLCQNDRYDFEFQENELFWRFFMKHFDFHGIFSSKFV